MPRKTTHAPPPPSRNGRVRGAVGGTPADRLIRAWLDGDRDGFEDLAEEFIAGGRDGVLAAAVRKLSERYEDDAVEDFADDLTEVAEAAEGQRDFNFASLVLLPVVAEGGPPPDPATLARGLAASGAFPPGAEVAFAAGWSTAEAVQALSPCAVRRVLLDVAGGRPSADLPLAPPGGGSDGGIAVLAGAVVFRTEPSEDDADLDPEALDAAEEAQDRERMDAFERWRASLGPEATEGALILPFCTPSALAYEIGAFLDGAGPEGGDVLDEIRDFVETAKGEADGEEVLARLTAREGGVELAVLTRSGRELDRRVFDLGDSGLTGADVSRFLEGSVPIVDGTG
ncbi:hypothetical protein GCM10009416_35280 [Craurococcus roseus]|uniref:Uncharacterized protein n=1 Tax=Craurococcus roseus TaxID=77585 RepID=A0ABP3QT53_9PROT